MRVAGKHDVGALTKLLAANDLPTDDLATLDIAWFRVVEQGERLVAAGGLEPMGKYALLRSLVADKSVRGSGVAGALVDALEQHARREEIEALYLLTTTADRYFAKRGYEVCDRETVPDVIKASEQFSSLCPDSATVMRKGM